MLSEAKGLVKKYRGVGWSREGVGHEVLSLVQGVGRVIFSYPQGVGHPIILNNNEKVDYACYIKHSQLELLLKYSQTFCARKYKG